MNSPSESPLPVVSPIPRYVEQFSGRGENENGRPFSFHTYTGPKGEKITTKFEAYETISEVERRFDQIYKSSLKVDEESPIIDKHGLHVGERALIQIRADSTELEFDLLLSNGSKLYIIRSDSVHTLQDFEKEFVPSILAAN
ncbi:MAG: hypothetical protein ACRD6X_21650 [Pyrinomonadaceae bacterium]